jgi:Domain of unknown function (DUF4157)
MKYQHLNQTKVVVNMPQSQTVQNFARSSQIKPHPIEELQGLIGNRTVNQLLKSPRQPPIKARPLFKGLSDELAIQAKLTIGKVGDKYEQEADRVASQVLEQIHASPTAQSTQGQSVQHQEEPEDELHDEPRISDLQRSLLSPAIQREARSQEEGLQVQSTLQCQEAIGGGEASTDLASAINRAKRSGQLLDTSLQRSMGQAMGADFSRVKVHTDAQSDQLNRSIQAKAFTTGQDVFFRQGSYQPGSREGQELIAHELTHVVQQNGEAVQRSPQPKQKLLHYPATEISSPIEPAASPPTSDQNPMLQRKIGLELEVPYIFSWKPKGLWGQVSAMNHASRRKRLKKGDPIIRGTGFELQGEDAPGDDTKSNIEFVTDAFDENQTGLNALTQAMTEINQIGTQMTANAQHGQFLDVGLLPGTKVVPTAFLQDAHKPIKAKVQSTFGLSLGNVAQFMEEIFATTHDAPDPRLTKGRAALTGYDPTVMERGGLDPINPGPILRTVGGAPAEAQTAINTLQSRFNNVPASTPELVSLLSMVIAYLKIGAGNGAPLVRSYAKTIAPVMARTDFAKMFSLLSDEEKAFYGGGTGGTWKYLVSIVPGLDVLTQPVYASGIAITSPVYRVDHSLDLLTRDLWLTGMATGTDYLTQYNFPDRHQRGEIEGLGSYQNKTDTSHTGQEMPIFELRAMMKAVDPTVAQAIGERGLYPMNEWTTLAQAILIYIWDLNHGSGSKYGE